MTLEHGVYAVVFPRLFRYSHIKALRFSSRVLPKPSNELIDGCLSQGVELDRYAELRQVPTDVPVLRSQRFDFLAQSAPPPP